MVLDPSRTYQFDLEPHILGGRFQLVSVVARQGRTGSGGHFTVFQGRFRYDDLQRSRRAIKATPREIPYILVYRRNIVT